MMTTKNKNKYFSFVQKQFSKFAVVLVVASMLFGTLGINQTSAYFSDEATISGNTFTAGTLSIDLNNTENYSSPLMYPTDTTSTSMDISNTGSLDSQYIVKITLSGSDTSVCDYVNMTATSTSPTGTYTGPIGGFVSTATPTASATWNYNFTISPTAPASVWGKTCFFKWTYTTWQTNLPNASTGFTSIEEKLGSIRIGKAVVLNEVLADPNTTSLAPANKEFIELYNNSNASFDLAGWQVSEISGTTEQKYTITLATTGSYRAVPYKGSTIIPAYKWITLLLSDGTALNDTGDTVRLYDFSGSVNLDEFSYPMAGQNIKPEGYSYARIPDGVGAWVDPIPTPGEANELADEIVPLVAPVVEAPVVVVPVVVETSPVVVAETPVVEAPVVEIPVVVAPVVVVETPVVVAPVVEAPVVVVLVVTPVVETPAVETPVVVAPVVESPAAEAPVVEVEAPANEIK